MNIRRIILLFLYFVFSINIYSDMTEDLLLIEKMFEKDLERKHIEKFGFYTYSFKNKNFLKKRMEIYFRYSGKNDCIKKKINLF